MPLTEIRERQARLRLLLSIVRCRSLTISYKRLLAALQIAVRRISPRLIVLTVYELVPFIVSFHDLRLLLRHCALAFRGHKLLDFLSKFADGFAVVEMPLMPCCIILWRTTHHHDEPFRVKIAEVVNKNVETFGTKLVVWNH